ncbi:MAG: malonate transporter [Rickettsiales bacterium]|jgi:malonate transporter
MLQILNSLFPVFVIIIFGYGAKHFKLIGDQFWPSAEKLVYYVLLPFLLFVKISTAKYQNISSYYGMIFSVMLTIVVIMILLFAGKYVFKIKNSDFISLFQGSVYANAAHIGIPAAYALFGTEGLVIYSILIAALVPFINAITIIVLSVYASENRDGILKNITQKLILHPIILSCLIGFMFNYFQIVLPELFFSSLEILGKAAIPLGLMVVGAALNINETRGSRKYIFASSFLKLILVPLVAIFFAKSFGVSELNTKILVLYTTLPTAVATYLLAKKMNGNAPLMAGIIVFQTIISLITMSLIITNYNFF